MVIQLTALWLYTDSIQLLHSTKPSIKSPWPLPYSFRLCTCHGIITGQLLASSCLSAMGTYHRSLCTLPPIPITVMSNIVVEYVTDKYLLCIPHCTPKPSHITFKTKAIATALGHIHLRLVNAENRGQRTTNANGHRRSVSGAFFSSLRRLSRPCITLLGSWNVFR